MTKPSAGERNYHVMYQLVQGAPAELRETLGLSKMKIEDFDYLKKSGCTSIDGVDDGEEYDIMVKALNDVNILQDEQENIFKIVAAILHLGNVHFVDVGDRESEIIPPEDDYDALEWASRLLQIDKDKMSATLTLATFQSQRRGGMVLKIGMSADTAQHMKDALARYIYSHLFEWLVWRVNESIAVDMGEEQKNEIASSIGVLDIFGFEVFPENSFEQLCINYTNEVLRMTLNVPH